MRGLSQLAGGLIGPVVVMLGWRWFVVPLGPPAIGYFHAMGLHLLVWFVTQRTLSERAAKELNEMSAGHSFGVHVLGPLVVLLMLWLLSFPTSYYGI